MLSQSPIKCYLSITELDEASQMPSVECCLLHFKESQLHNLLIQFTAIKTINVDARVLILSFGLELDE